MTSHIPSTRLIDRRPFVILSNSMPPRDPDECEEDEDEKRTPTNHRSCASRTKTKQDGLLAWPDWHKKRPREGPL